MEDKEELRPKDLCLGNYIDCFGNIEVVTGIVPRESGDWYVCHSGNHKLNTPFSPGIEFSCQPIWLTQDWKKFLRVEKYRFPVWVIYVHQAQNYMKWYANIDLSTNFRWEFFKELTAD